MQREYGPMLAAERRARKGELHSGKTQIQDLEDKTLEPKEGVKLSASNAIVPLLVLVIGAFTSFILAVLLHLRAILLKMPLQIHFHFQHLKILLAQLTLLHRYFKQHCSLV